MSTAILAHAAAGAVQPDGQRRALWISGAILACSLLLQRFAVPFGGKQLSIVGPIGLALVVYGLLNGAFVLHRGRLIIYLALVTLVLTGIAWHSAAPSGLVSGLNVNSVAQFLILTAFATVSFVEPVPEAMFFRLMTQLLIVVAIAGIVQFALQFAGLGLFAFTGLLPDSVLFESGYNLVIPVGIGGILKSNGFVLVEPSVFSQLMALGLIIEATGIRRLRYLAGFTAGLLLSFSGTGWIVIAAFVVGSAVGMGRKGLLIAAGVVGLLAVVLVAGAVLAPDFLAAVSGRFDEFSRPGSSGHLRFITPFWMITDVMNANPGAFLLGIGSGATDHLVLPYDYNVNTPIKIMVEYGAPVLVAYVLLFIWGRKTPQQASLVLPAVVLFMFTGGYQQFPPMIFIVLLLTSVARLTTGDQARIASPVMIIDGAAVIARPVR